MPTHEPGSADQPPSASGRGLTTAFLGAVTAAGMAVVLLVSAVMVTYLVAHEQHDDLPTVARAVVSGTPTVDVVAATVLAGTIFGAFFCGGYVAARLSGRDGRRQGFLVWAWTLPMPLGLIALAILGDSLARRVVAGSSTTLVCGSLVVLALLGALAGGDIGQRAPVLPAQAADPGPALLDAAPVAALASPVS